MYRSMLLAGTATLALAIASSSAALAASPLVFEGVKAPTTDAERREVLASDKVTVDGKTADIGYHTLLRTGDKVGDGTFGLIMDQTGKPILMKDGSQMISNATDFSSLLEKGGKLYVVSHFETRPAAIYLTEVKRDAKTGELTPVSTQPVDFSELGGLWVPCAGSVTPWGTQLGSEEYEPDAEAVETTTDIKELDDYMKPMALYFGYDASADDATMEGFRKVFNPYRYGYITEVSLGADKPKGVKHYAMGRFSHELGYVMPDETTVYMSDDGTNVGFYRFVADESGKLDAGTLYAAKFDQTSAENGGSFDLSWVDLGHATSDDVHAQIEKGLEFSDIFDKQDMAEDGSCAEGFSPSVANEVQECLKVKDGMDLAASRLETRRYAAIKGATVEIRKEEGITFDPAKQTLYVAISEISKGMEDMKSKGKDSGKFDLGGNNDIRVDYNPCGGVYALNVNDNMVATDMKAIITGTPKEYGADSPYAGNTCDMDGLANPDNISAVAGRETLFIGEDTETGHQNDFVWAYDIADGKLTRIQTTPYGSETTSVYAYPDVDGHGYLMSVIQHPYGESDEDKLTDPKQAAAYLGYIGPMPKLD